MIEEITIKFGMKLKPTQNSCKSQLYKKCTEDPCQKKKKNCLRIYLNSEHVSQFILNLLRFSKSQYQAQ